MSQSTGTRKWLVQVSAGDSLCLAMPEVEQGRAGRTTPGGGGGADAADTVVLVKLC